MIYWLDFVAIVFASAAIIDVWQKGSIFATTRAYLQAVQDNTDPDSLKGRVLELLGCAYCESYHVPVYLLAALVGADYVSSWAGLLVRVFIYGWAATRIGNIIDGLLPPRMRYSPPFDIEKE